MPVALERQIPVTIVHDFLQEGERVAEELGTFEIVRRMSREWPGAQVGMSLGKLCLAIERRDVLGAEEASDEIEKALHHASISYDRDEDEQLGTDVAAITAVVAVLRIECDRRANEIFPGRERDLIEG
ncbi:hypothetical protein ISS86_02460 [Candidatus Microgenomates bacterium]|nr:hypothetical protein [Candidatus Microgenomates bacterium]